MLDNIQKVMIPEEINAIGLSISRLELLALLFIDRTGIMTMSSLAQAMTAPMSTVTGIVDRLVKKGLLGRGGSPEDRRIVTVSLTEAGQSLVSNLQKHFHTIIGRIREVLSDEEFQLAAQLLQKVITGLQSQKAELEQAGPRRKKITVE
jgi:DNA-binding MarR family transcriptional regulator